MDSIWMPGSVEADLHGYLRYIHDRLKACGHLHLTGITPAVIRKEKRRQVYRLVMPLEHMNFFTARSLDVLVRKHGFERIRIRHMFQAIAKPLDYVTPFLKNFIFRGFYPTGSLEADLMKL